MECSYCERLIKPGVEHGMGYCTFPLHPVPRDAAEDAFWDACVVAMAARHGDEGSVLSWIVHNVVEAADRLVIERRKRRGGK